LPHRSSWSETFSGSYSATWSRNAAQTSPSIPVAVLGERERLETERALVLPQINAAGPPLALPFVQVIENWQNFVRRLIVHDENPALQIISFYTIRVGVTARFGRIIHRSPEDQSGLLHQKSCGRNPSVTRNTEANYQKLYPRAADRWRCRSPLCRANNLGSI
jgi:hypothetical protein